MHVYDYTIQLHDTDAYAILFFANQFKICHNGLQGYLESIGMPLGKNRASAGFVAVVVRAESDYLAPVELGDRLRCEMRTAHIGTTAFTNAFTFTNQAGVKVGTATIVQVTLDPVTGKKAPIPAAFRAALERNRD